MKNTISVIALAGLLSGTLVAGCDKTTEQKLDGAKENVQEAKQTLNNDKKEYLADWQKFKAESEQTLQANQRRIDAFKVENE